MVLYEVKINRKASECHIMLKNGVFMAILKDKKIGKCQDIQLICIKILQFSPNPKNF